MLWKRSSKEVSIKFRLEERPKFTAICKKKPPITQSQRSCNSLQYYVRGLNRVRCFVLMFFFILRAGKECRICLFPYEIGLKKLDSLGLGFSLLSTRYIL